MKRLPPLHALRAFDAAVRTGSFTRAGEALHVTQGAISRQIKQLEDWLGKSVFVRHYQGLILTPAGSVLAKGLDRAQSFVQRFHQPHPENDPACGFQDRQKKFGLVRNRNFVLYELVYVLLSSLTQT